LSHVAVIKATITGYRDAWLYALALLSDIDVPQVELEAELAAAAFSLVSWLEHPEEQAQHHHTTPVSVDDTDSEDEYRFSWDTPTVPCPKELLALWGRAKDGEKKVSIKDILEGLAPMEGLPNKPPETTSCHLGRRLRTAPSRCSANNCCISFVSGHIGMRRKCP
jgi:hypothetical protein